MSSIRVFEAAARLENFTSAARELGMSQAAVSLQVRSLETHLGVKLFAREGRRVVLTGAARRLAGGLGRCLDQMANAFELVRLNEERTLVIASDATFAAAWLAARVGEFQHRNPDVQVRLMAIDGSDPVDADFVDVSIRQGLGVWPGSSAELLVKDHLTPMCSPDFLHRRGGKSEALEFSRLPLVSAPSPAWDAWLRETGSSSPFSASGGVKMSSQLYDAQAAMAGQGVALLTPFLWEAELVRGRLVRLSDATIEGLGYWAVQSDLRPMSQLVKRFLFWLKSKFPKPVDVMG